MSDRHPCPHLSLTGGRHDLWRCHMCGEVTHFGEVIFRPNIPSACPPPSEAERLAQVKKQIVAECLDWSVSGYFQNDTSDPEIWDAHVTSKNRVDFNVYDQPTELAALESALAAARAAQDGPR